MLTLGPSLNTRHPHFASKIITCVPFSTLIPQILHRPQTGNLSSVLHQCWHLQRWWAINREGSHGPALHNPLHPDPPMECMVRWHKSRIFDRCTGKKLNLIDRCTDKKHHSCTEGTKWHVQQSNPKLQYLGQYLKSSDRNCSYQGPRMLQQQLLSSLGDGDGSKRSGTKAKGKEKWRSEVKFFPQCIDSCIQTSKQAKTQTWTTLLTF